MIINNKLVQKIYNTHSIIKSESIIWILTTNIQTQRIITTESIIRIVQKKVHWQIESEPFSQTHQIVKSDSKMHTYSQNKPANEILNVNRKSKLEQKAKQTTRIITS